MVSKSKLAVTTLKHHTMTVLIILEVLFLVWRLLREQKHCYCRTHITAASVTSPNCVYYTNLKHVMAISWTWVHELVEYEIAVKSRPVFTGTLIQQCIGFIRLFAISRPVRPTMRRGDGDKCAMNKAADYRAVVNSEQSMPVDHVAWRGGGVVTRELNSCAGAGQVVAYKMAAPAVPRAQLSQLSLCSCPVPHSSSNSGNRPTPPFYPRLPLYAYSLQATAKEWTVSRQNTGFLEKTNLLGAYNDLWIFLTAFQLQRLLWMFLERLM